MFVPPPPPPSPRAQELGEQLALFVREYIAENPDVRPRDVDAAFAVARRRLPEHFGDAKRIKTLLVLALGLAMMVLVAVGGMARTTNRPTVLILVVGVAAVMAGLMAVAFARR